MVTCRRLCLILQSLLKVAEALAEDINVLVVKWIEPC